MNSLVCVLIYLQRWGPLVKQDLSGFVEKAKTVFAPPQRAHSLVSSGPLDRVTRNFSDHRIHKERQAESEAKGAPTKSHEGITHERLKKSLEKRLAIPGLIVHTYKNRGNSSRLFGRLLLWTIETHRSL